jgi:SAM-dependent methyltransferase
MSLFDHYARFYDLLYLNKDYAGEARFIHQLLAQGGAAPGSLLELGCGTGRHAIEFAQLGWQVDGVDLSPDMVAQAKARALQQDPALASRLSFQPSDVRTVRTGRKYAAAISLFHVMSYQATHADLLAAITSAATHLAPGGVFFFDFWYGPAVLSDPPHVRVKRLQDPVFEAVRLAEPEMLTERNQVKVNYQILIKDLASGRQSDLRESHTMRYLFLPEIENLLQAAGFELRASGACYSDRPLGPDTWFGWVLAVKSGA